MKKNIYFTFVFLLLLSSSCKSAEQIPLEFRQKHSKYKQSVHFYGSPHCGHCLGFSSNMQKEGIPFVFHNVRASDKANREMWKLVHIVDPDKNSLRFPVLNVNGKVLISPSWLDFKKEIHRLK